jgi:hypothetical protein
MHLALSHLLTHSPYEEWESDLALSFWEGQNI